MTEPTAARRTRIRSVARIVGRIVGGLAGLGLAGAAVLGSTLPLPTIVGAADPVTVVPEAADLLQVCAGPLLLAGGGETASTASPVGSEVVTRDVVGGDESSQRPPSSGGLASGGSAGLVLRLPVDGDDSSLGAAQSQTAGSADLAGFAAADCIEPGNDQWLLGGSTITGRSSLLVLSNPDEVDAVVDLDILAETGAVNVAGMDGIVIGAGTQQVLPLAAFAPGAEALAVHVTSRGGQIAASLQQSTVRVLEAGGADITQTGAAPAMEQIITGLRIAGGERVQERSGEADWADLASVVRVVVPGELPANVAIEVLPAGGSSDSAEPAVEAEVQPGEAADLVLPGLVDGTYALRISADQPIAAAARSAVLAEDGATDFAWLAASAALGDDTVVVVPEGPSSQLTLANPDEIERLVRVDGEERTVPAGGSLAIAVDGGASLRLEGAEGLRAGVSFVSGTQIAAFPVEAPAPVAGTVRIRP